MTFTWETLTAFSTTVLVVVGIWQISRIRSEAKKERTLAICNRYDSDVILDKSLRKLRCAHESHDVEENPLKYKWDVMCVLNYLDSVAIGIAQNVYDGEIAKEHLRTILNGHVEDYFESQRIEAFGIQRDNYQNLLTLYAWWARPDVTICWWGLDA